MGCTILCIGTELLTGEILNTNARFIAEQLSDHGICVDAEITVPDTPSAIIGALHAALAQSDLVITSGGLGPTQDDLTKQSIADALGLELVPNEALAASIRGKYKGTSKKTLNASWQRQATVPAGAEILPNDWGTAPGLWCTRNGKVVAMLPGPPRELEPMFGKYLLARITALIAPTLSRRRVAVFGLGESHTEERVLTVLRNFPNVEAAYCAKLDCCHVRLTTRHDEQAILDAAYQELLRTFGDLAAPCEVSQAEIICTLVRSMNARLGTAESCTGGGIAQAITSVAGVSDVFQGGIVTYSNEMKMQCLGVREATLAIHGAVSKPVVIEMVQGLLERYKLTVGVAVSGIAGPGGGTPEKPVGTVHIASAIGTDIQHLHQVFNYGRLGMRERTTIAALRLLHQHLLAHLARKTEKN